LNRKRASPASRRTTIGLNSKLLYEAYLLKAPPNSISCLKGLKKIADALYRHLVRHDELRNTIASVGLPILADAPHILRGPFIRILERRHKPRR
jgi:hypothetical protein